MCGAVPGETKVRVHPFKSLSFRNYFELKKTIFHFFLDDDYIQSFLAKDICLRISDKVFLL